MTPCRVQLFIGNIPHECDKEAIQAFCERVGPVHHLHVPPAKVPGAQNPGYAFAMYKSRIVAAEAIEQLAGQSVLPSNPRPLVRPAPPPSTRAQWAVHCRASRAGAVPQQQG